MYIIGFKETRERREETPKMCTYHKDTTTKPKVPPLNHEPLTFVATYISTRRCLIRREKSGGKCVVLGVSSPTSSSHVEPDEKKLNGNNFLITILAAISSRTEKKNTNTEQ